MRAQRITCSVRDRMPSERTMPAPPAQDVWPSAIVAAAAIGSALWVLRSWIVSRRRA
jgi:hypothetical protein